LTNPYTVEEQQQLGPWAAGVGGYALESPAHTYGILVFATD
jgi:hypothetical protein